MVSATCAYCRTVFVYTSRDVRRIMYTLTTTPNFVGAGYYVECPSCHKYNRCPMAVKKIGDDPEVPVKP